MASDDQPIRPLLVAPYGEYGGSEMVMMRLLGEFDGRIEVQALLLGGGRFAEMLRADGIRTEVESLPGKKGLLRFPGALLRARKHFRDAGISLIHANGTKAVIFSIPLSRMLGVPLLWMKHDHFWDGFVSKLLARFCGRLICVSEAMAAQFSPQVRARTAIAYPGVRIGPAEDVRQTEPLIVCVGRLDPAKGFYDVIRATKILRDRGVDARLRVAGPVDRIHTGHAAELEQLVVDLELSEWAEVGWVDDLDELYRRSRVVAMASRPEVPGKPSEGAPTVLMEAMAQRRPVVAPREAGMEEVMGPVGTLVDDLTPEGLADALEPYLRDVDLAARVGDEGRERAVERFSMERTVQTLETVYTEMAR
jgi:glycosyltransferase involved in cell wall biosynthesis